MENLELISNKQVLLTGSVYKTYGSGEKTDRAM